MTNCGRTMSKSLQKHNSIDNAKNVNANINRTNCVPIYNVCDITYRFNIDQTGTVRRLRIIHTQNSQIVIVILLTFSGKSACVLPQLIKQVVGESRTTHFVTFLSKTDEIMVINKCHFDEGANAARAQASSSGRGA